MKLKVMRIGTIVSDGGKKYRGEFEVEKMTDGLKHLVKQGILKEIKRGKKDGVSTNK